MRVGKRFVAVSLACLPVAAFGQGSDGVVSAGLELARNACATCHLVAPGDTSLIGKPAASFQEIANAPGMSDMALSIWLRSPHRNMPHLQLSDSQIEDLVAYIASLRARK